MDIIPCNEQVVRELVAAGLDGMTRYASTHDTTSSEVVNAMVNMATQAIDLICSGENLSPEQRQFNRRAARNTLQQLLLKTIDDSQVM